MKKFLCLFGAMALTLASCSSDDNNDDAVNSVDVILPKMVKYTDIDYPAENSSKTIIYNGNKLVSVSNEGLRADYTYEGNFIVKEITYNIVNGKDSKRYEISYKYSDGKLASTSAIENFTAEFPYGQYNRRYVYTHSVDGTVTKESYSTNSQTGIEEKSNYSELLTFVNGNLVKMVETDISPSGNYVRTSIYEYDTKNSPLKNVLGFNLLLDEDLSSANNLVKHTYSSVYGTDSQISGPYTYITSYEYNADGYPTKVVLYKQGGTSVNEINEYTY
ncbi:hypothetical protein [Flavobacterium hydatis]|uniref:DUF4595 domain-containing protein n=1 Tax=Flavobacterium hydatis TaxID=991 RepID=A0A086AQ47_FLAHY|nr:hypothetical protein [Flavobacterium hydatis]KFF18811.1 hypothetical protein IW20_04380 [Flavobacterium hydatis]OXA88774.1 hypothetical protein B0A62_21255 [Flavobacterium hydatis]